MRSVADKNPFQNKRWQTQHIREIRRLAGARYTPKLNIHLPISEIFDGLGRTEDFYTNIRKHFGDLVRAWGRALHPQSESTIKELADRLTADMSLLKSMLSGIRQYDTASISWRDIASTTSEASDLSQKLIEEMRRVRQTEEKRFAGPSVDGDPTVHPRDMYTTEMHYLYELQRELAFFEEFSQSVTARLSNEPLLLLTGQAGFGKTHLMCDVVEMRLKHKYPTVLVFGEHFRGRRNPWSQIIEQAGLSTRLRSRTKLLESLDEAGKKRKVRSLIVIDALNESTPGYWKSNIDQLINELAKYKNIALAVSIRTGFQTESLSTEQIKRFVCEDHPGFRFREWEAVTKFFKEFNLPLPEVPLLTPEFQHPLFLLLFCKGFSEREEQNRKRSARQSKQVFRGHEGATYIFETFVKHTADRIAKELGLPPGRNKRNEYVIWDTVIEKMAARMVSTQIKERISETALKKILGGSHPEVPEGAFIRSLERNLLVTKVPRSERGKVLGYDFRFPFQKFSDHLVARFLLNKYLKKKIGEGEIIREDSPFGRFLARYQHSGVIEALSVQIPERLHGRELVDVAPYIKDSYTVQSSFVESLIWRNPSAFQIDENRAPQNALRYINEVIAKSKGGHESLLNAFLTVASVPSHPFNSNRLHTHLSRFTMPERDSWWSTFLHNEHGARGAVDRLVEWASSPQDKSHISDDSLFLVSTSLAWFLTTSNRSLRDKTTKALVCLLSRHLSIVRQLLERFVEVNDSYVKERLFAVAYGCVLRNSLDKDGHKELAVWVYERIFRDGAPPRHVLGTTHEGLQKQHFRGN